MSFCKRGAGGSAALSPMAKDRACGARVWCSELQIVSAQRQMRRTVDKESFNRTNRNELQCEMQ